MVKMDAFMNAAIEKYDFFLKQPLPYLNNYNHYSIGSNFQETPITPVPMAPPASLEFAHPVDVSSTNVIRSSNTATFSNSTNVQAFSSTLNTAQPKESQVSDEKPKEETSLITF